MGDMRRRVSDGDTEPDSRSSLEIVLEYARYSYDQQFASLDAYRARAGSLLAFAAVLVALSAGTGPPGTAAVTKGLGTMFVVASAVLFLVASAAERLQVAPSTHALDEFELDASRRTTQERLLRSTLDVLGANRRVLTRVRTVLSIGLLCLLMGTIIIGMRMTLLLP